MIERMAFICQEHVPDSCRNTRFGPAPGETFAAGKRQFSNSLTKIIAG